MPKRLTIEHCREVAELNNGMCLSKDYINSKKKLLWRCDKNHEWFNGLGHVKRGQWCPFCYGNVTKCINDCIKIAKKNNGKFLSDFYKNNKTKYKWQCEFGHFWHMRYDMVVRGQWCPVCAKEKLKKTLLAKYGVENLFASKEIQTKIKNTNIKKYGVRYAMQNRRIATKSARGMTNSYILSHWKTNEELVCVGSYEKKTVEQLNKNQIHYQWQPRIFQMSDGKTYRPDLFLTDEDKWIEIKGYFRKDAQEKWEWFHKEHPNSELWDKEKLKELQILT
jgi:hypothetical protein